MLGRPLSGIMPPLLLTGICLISAWRRCSLPVYTLTDDELLIGTGLIGKKRIAWREIQEVKQDGYGVHLIGREWFGGTHLHLSRLPKAARDEFLQLVQTKIGQANDRHTSAGESGEKCCGKEGEGHGNEGPDIHV
jgi:hypothetical protein